MIRKPQNLRSFRRSLADKDGYPSGLFSRQSGAYRVFSTGPFAIGTTAITIVNQIPMPANAVGVRLVYGSQNQAATITTAKVASPTTDGNDGSGLTWTQATFSGATTGSISAGSGTTPNEVPTLLISDFIPITPANASLPLLQVRTYFAAAAIADNPAAGELAAWNTKTGKLWKSGYKSGVIADNAPIDGAGALSTGQLILPYAVIWYFDVPAVTVAAVGGSIPRGQSSTGNAYGFVYQACDLKTTANMVYTPYIAARSGSNTTASLAQVQEICSKIGPQKLLIPIGSGNDAALTVAGFAAMRSRVSRAIEICRQYNVEPILSTLPPSSALDAATDLRRRDHNEWGKRKAAELGVKVADIATAVEDPSNRAILRSDCDGGDGTHLSDNGHAIAAAVFAACL